MSAREFAVVACVSAVVCFLLLLAFDLVNVA